MRPQLSAAMRLMDKALPMLKAGAVTTAAMMLTERALTLGPSNPPHFQTWAPCWVFVTRQLVRAAVAMLQHYPEKMKIRQSRHRTLHPAQKLQSACQFARNT